MGVEGGVECWVGGGKGGEGRVRGVYIGGLKKDIEWRGGWGKEELSAFERSYISGSEGREVTVDIAEREEPVEAARFTQLQLSQTQSQKLAVNNTPHL